MAQAWHPSPEQSREGQSLLMSPEALERLFETLRPCLRQIALKELRCDILAKEDPSDLVQQTYLEASRDLSTCSATTEKGIGAWLRGIFRHRLAKLVRRYRKTKKRNVNLEVQLKNEPQISSSENPVRRASSREQERLLAEAIARLPDDYRRVVLLHSQFEKSFEDISGMIDRSPEAVRKLWSRALEWLRVELEPHR